MGLNKDNENYYYNLGRTVALVEIMNGLSTRLMSQVFDNAFAALPYQLKKALFNDKHNLHAELLEPANVVLMKGEIPHGVMTACDSNGSYAIGYYHQKHYLEEKYHGIYGKVETVVVEHVPEKVEYTPDGVSVKDCDNIIEELKRAQA